MTGVEEGRPVRRVGATVMQDVLLEEDEPDVGRSADEARAALRREATWAGHLLARHPWRSAVVVAVVVALVVTVPVLVLRASRAAVLAEPAFDGAVRSQPRAPVERWRAELARGFEVGVTGDTLVAHGTDAADAVVRGYDVVTGTPRWATVLPDPGYPGMVDCRTSPMPPAAAGAEPERGAEAPVVCLVGLGLHVDGGPEPPRGPVRVVTLDGTTGALLGDRRATGVVLGWDLVGGDVVLASDVWRHVGLERSDAVTGETRWRTVSTHALRVRGTWTVRVESRAGVVLAATATSYLLVDAATGEAVVDPDPDVREAYGAQLVRGGHLVASGTRLDEGRIEAIATALSVDGDPEFETPGRLIEPAVVDSDAGQLYSWTSLLGRATSGRVHAIDPVTGARRWESGGPADGVTIEVDGIAVLAGAGVAVATDVDTGRQLWRVALGANGALPVLTDGERVLVVRLEPGQGAVIAGIDLHTGDREWETVLPAGITEVRERSGFLVGTGPGVVVLLR